ncbi:hypothetical protein ACFVP0_03925 [Streptomyces cinereoruber]|uniref:hypothetical protein n=1 Tax=Streptomyces cinereoruber TaxID=67260 RepID=UPI0036AA1E89
MLVDQRPEPLTALLLNATCLRVRALCETWCYRKVGGQQPFAGVLLHAVTFYGLPGPRAGLVRES